MIPFGKFILLDATEKKKEYLSRMYSNVTPQMIETFDNVDPSKGKYLEWLVKMQSKGQFRDSGDIAQAVLNLTTFLQKSKKSDWKGEKDLNKYKTVPDLAIAIRANATKALSKDEINKKPELLGGNTILKVKKNFLFDKNSSFPVIATLWKLENYKDFLAFDPKKNTEWCVSYPDQWKEYGPPFYMITGKEPDTNREGFGELFYLLHVPSFQCMDTMDREAPIEIFERLGLPVKDLVKEYFDNAPEDEISVYDITRKIDDGWSRKEDAVSKVKEILQLDNDGWVSFAQLSDAVENDLVSITAASKKLKEMLDEGVSINLRFAGGGFRSKNRKFFDKMPIDVFKKYLLAAKDFREDERRIAFNTLEIYLHRTDGKRDKDIEKKILEDLDDFSDIDFYKYIFGTYLRIVRDPWPEFETYAKRSWLGLNDEHWGGNITDYIDKPHPLSYEQLKVMKAFYRLWDSYVAKHKTPIAAEMRESFGKILDDHNVLKNTF